MPTGPAGPVCPVCAKPVEPPANNRWFPFCSARCKEVDLARWLNGEYRIPERNPERGNGANGGGAPPADGED